MRRNRKRAFVPKCSDAKTNSKSHHLWIRWSPLKQPKHTLTFQETARKQVVLITIAHIRIVVTLTKVDVIKTPLLFCSQWRFGNLGNLPELHVKCISNICLSENLENIIYYKLQLVAKPSQPSFVRKHTCFVMQWEWAHVNTMHVISCQPEIEPA